MNINPLIKQLEDKERDTVPVTKKEIQTFIVNPWAAVAIPATVRIEPETLNLKRKGVFTAFIALPEGYNVADIDINTVVCEGAKAVKGMIDGTVFIAKFDREDLRESLPAGDAVELTVTGELKDGTSFKGSDTIRVIDKGKGGK